MVASIFKVTLLYVNVPGSVLPGPPDNRRMISPSVPGDAGLSDATSNDQGAAAVCAQPAPEAKRNRPLPIMVRIVVDLLCITVGRPFHTRLGKRTSGNLRQPQGATAPVYDDMASKRIGISRRLTPAVFTLTEAHSNSGDAPPGLCKIRYSADKKYTYNKFCSSHPVPLRRNTRKPASQRVFPQNRVLNIDATWCENLQTKSHKSTNYLVLDTRTTPQGLDL